MLAYSHDTTLLASDYASQVVPEASAVLNTGRGDQFPAATADHLNIVRFKHVSNTSYRNLLAILVDVNRSGEDCT